MAGAICRALVCGVALAVFTPAAGANKQSNLILSISSSIDSDSNAALAAKHWINEFSADATPSIQTLKGVSPAKTQTGIVLVPLIEWSRNLPAFNILRLPFFYTGISDVHRAIDGQTGLQLSHISAAAGWKLLAIWDDGMTVFSGNQDYSRLLNLKGMEFATWKPDPLQMTELRALDVWLRVIAKNGVQRNAQQCIVDSRSTTPTHLWHEHLQRVHLDITLTGDRFEGYVLAMPIPYWRRMNVSQRHDIINTLRRISAWQRSNAARQQQEALLALHKAGMELHSLSGKQRQIFISHMPPWRDFFGTLDKNIVNELIATARTAATTGSVIGTRKNTPAYTLPTTNATQ
jgi:TRAP-type C4-dicarboxylate transport system substrate-binding protein